MPGQLARIDSPVRGRDRDVVDEQVSSTVDPPKGNGLGPKKALHLPVLGLPARGYSFIRQTVQVCKGLRCLCKLLHTSLGTLVVFRGLAKADGA